MLPLLLPAVLAGEPSIPNETFTLDNGLTVVLVEDHSVPFVQVNVWYWVGSANEEPGRTGFAHLFEHLMFQGSQHAPDDYFKPLQKVGGQVNGTTNLDRTNYFEGVPSEFLPLALYMESDRMGFLLDALDEQKLQNQKDVVRNERRQRYDNVPYGNAWPTLLENLFPEGHPYHTATIGRHEDIEAATLEDVKAFFRKWYVPNNATLTICGDFDPKVAKRQVKRWFGDLPAGEEPAPRTFTPVVLDGEKRVRATDDVPFEKVWIAWPTPKLFAPGDAELDLLSQALTSGKDSRLYESLVHERQIAQDVSAAQVSHNLQSLYMIVATAAEGHTAAEVVAAVDEELAKLRESGVTAEEVATAKTAYEVGFWEALLTISGKADQVQSYLRYLGKPDGLADDLARYRAATPDSVNAALRQWLPPDKRLVLEIVPEVKP
ncbi:MAG: M16 family metallopeptidase [Myxococcota bacterium]